MKKVTQKTKKVAPKKVVSVKVHTTDEVKRYIGAVTEDFQHRVSAIAEQFFGLNEKIDANTNRLEEKLDEHGKILNSHTEMIGRLMIDVEDIKVGMSEKVNRGDFNKLESRLVSLESFVFSKQGKSPKMPK